MRKRFPLSLKPFPKGQGLARRPSDGLHCLTRTGRKRGIGHLGQVDTSVHSLGIKVSAKEMEALNVHRLGFHGEWNYTLDPGYVMGKWFFASP